MPDLDGIDDVLDTSIKCVLSLLGDSRACARWLTLTDGAAVELGARVTSMSTRSAYSRPFMRHRRGRRMTRLNRTGTVTVQCGAPRAALDLGVVNRHLFYLCANRTRRVMCSDSTSRLLRKFFLCTKDLIPRIFRICTVFRAVSVKARSAVCPRAPFAAQRRKGSFFGSCRRSWLAMYNCADRGTT